VKWAFVDHGALDASAPGWAAVDALDPLIESVSTRDARSALLSGQSRPEAVARIAAHLRQNGVEVDIIATGDRSLPVAPAYGELGCDRWLALQHAWRETRGPLVVIDCGTAITIDLVDGSGVHRGGWILAGIGSARDGLLSKAPGLHRPPADAGNAERPARTTAEAVERGSLLLAAGGIERAVRAAEREAEADIALWMTGGDAAALADRIDRSARQEPHLVLHGLAMATQAT
jgi:type III pantothenate kinase